MSFHAHYFTLLEILARIAVPVKPLLLYQLSAAFKILVFKHFIDERVEGLVFQADAEFRGQVKEVGEEIVAAEAALFQLSIAFLI